MTLNPPEHRARQYSNEFSSYDEPTQTRLHAATIAAGDDRTAVYIALGKPNERRVGYDRNKATSRTVLLEYWYYAGYPASEVEGHFVTLNNGGFASPLGSRPYGRVVVEFADGRVRSFGHDPERNVQSRGDGRMAVPPDPHH